MSLTVSARQNRGRPVQFEDPYFRFSCVDGTPDLETTYRIRYQVYCIERGFLPQDAYPNGLEFDEYDGQALHLLATHRGGQPAGTARLVMNSPLGFPILKHCIFSDEYEFMNDPAHPALAGYGEVSRMAISKVFRRREGDSFYGAPPRRDSAPATEGVENIFSAPANMPEILIGLCRLYYQESKRRGLTHWMMAMERGLYVLLRRMGFLFQPAGPEIDYYGFVRPYVASIAAFEVRLHASFPMTLKYLAQGLDPDLVPPYVQRPDQNWQENQCFA